jgi:ABC-type transport system involved in cytochrome c biogenesis permease component
MVISLCISDYASLWRYIVRSTRLHALLAAGLFLLFTGSGIFADQILFQDDFDNGSMENWELILGEFIVVDGKFCIEECPS